HHDGRPRATARRHATRRRSHHRVGAQPPPSRSQAQHLRVRPNAAPPRELMSTLQARPAGAARVAEPWERRFFGLVFASLVLGLPNEWSRTYFGSQGTKSAILFSHPVLLLAVFYGMQRRAAFMKAIWTDPFIPLLLLWALMSTVWSTSFGTTARQTIAWSLATAFAFYAVTRFDLREILRITALTMLVGTALNLLFIFALPRWGKVVDAVDANNSGWKGIASNKN